MSLTDYFATMLGTTPTAATYPTRLKLQHRGKILGGFTTIYALFVLDSG